MNILQKPMEEMKWYVIKYDYDDCTGFGAIILSALSHDDAIIRFKSYMFDRNNKGKGSVDEWYEHTYRNADFRFVSKNIFGWYQYMNNSANVCIKVREICDQYGDIIPIQECFEDARIEHLL